MVPIASMAERAGVAGMLGTVYLRLGRRPEARAQYKKAVKDGTGYVVDNAAVNLGLFDFFDAKYESAVAWFDQAIGSADASARWIAVKYRALSLKASGDIAAAIPALEEALRIGPAAERSWIEYRLVRVLLDAGREDKARPHLEAIEADPDADAEDRAYAAFDLGVWWLRRGDKQRAWSFLQFAANSGTEVADEAALRLRQLQTVNGQA